VDKVTVVDEVTQVLTIDEVTKVTVLDEIIQIVTLGEQGPPGPPGSNGEATTYISKQANANISGGFVVQIVGTNLVDYADKDDSSSMNNVLGITTNAAIQGSQVNVQVGGELVEPTWSWTVGMPIYLGNAGQLTQTVPTTGFLLQVAIPTSSTSLIVGAKQPILLTQN